MGLVFPPLHGSFLQMSKRLCDTFTSHAVPDKKVVSFSGRSGNVVPLFTDYEIHYAPKRRIERLVKSPYDLAGTLDSSLVYTIDGVIDMTGTGITINIPDGGLQIRGEGALVSRIICTDPNYTLFTGGGSLNMRRTSVIINGTNSQVFNLEATIGTESIELREVRFVFCSSLGQIDSYNQGFEDSTVRFGGSPTLQLSGPWNGWFIQSAVITSLAAGMTTPIFQEGTGLLFSSTFTATMNCDLPSSAPLCDFDSSNFTDESSFRLNNCTITRNTLVSPSDGNILPNITADELEAYHKGNVGIYNTYPGGVLVLTAAAATIIPLVSVYYPINGTFILMDESHFNSPVPNSIGHEGNSPNEYLLSADLILEGKANDSISVRLLIWDSSVSSASVLTERTAVINNFSGGEDRAYMYIVEALELFAGDYVYMEVRNNTGTSSITLLEDSFIKINER